MTHGRPGFARRGRPAVLVCALLLAGSPAAAAEAGPRYTAWQEIVLLTVSKVRQAAASCGFAPDPGRVDALLSAAALGEADVARQAFSPSLKRQVAADADSYLDNKDTACAAAWSRFGPDGAPGIRDTLKR